MLPKDFFNFRIRYIKNLRDCGISLNDLLIKQKIKIIESN